MKLDAIAFDADDTLWHNEDWFAAAETQFVSILARWSDADDARKMLLSTETRNLGLFGYGVKSFTLSMFEAAMELSGGAVASSDLAKLFDLGKSMLQRPTELLEGVVEVVSELSAQRHRLLVITKGDLHHQERKVQGSGIAHYFEAIEVVSEKDPQTYARLAARHRIEPGRLMMVGNSVPSDVAPVVAIGGFGVHIPYEFTWAHEVMPDDNMRAYDLMDDEPETTQDSPAEGVKRFWKLASILDLPGLIERIDAAA